MKITTFNPTIVSSKSEDIIKLFEALGFEKRHHNVEVEDRPSYRLKDANGFYVDVVQNDEATQDHTVIRMNVDNFDEAHEILLAHGFKDGPRLLDKKSAKSTGMISPSGFIIGLVEHKKNHDWQLSNITVCTLHYYDEIGLFTPKEVSDAGYRLYDDKALEKLQQILIFRGENHITVRAK